MTEFPQSTTQSFNVADNHLDNILQKICHQGWEKEVVEKKGKPHAIGWVFSQAQDCYFLKPDPAKVTTQFDIGDDEEPVSTQLFLNQKILDTGSWQGGLACDRPCARQDQTP